MTGLSLAHRGYDYQDLLVACRLVDVLLGTVPEIHCDQKLVADDRFDDLTTVDFAGARERAQFKHTDVEDRPLSLETFTGDQRQLRLDRLFASMLADRVGPGSGANGSLFRVVLRDSFPTDSRLLSVLGLRTPPRASLVPGIGTEQLGFDPDVLWSQYRTSSASGDAPFAFLRDKLQLDYDDLRWACDCLVIEVGAPPASFDIADPAAAEEMLLLRARSEVGAESFPNADRSAIDVAAALVSAARAAREDLFTPDALELLRRTRLRSDFGAVASAHPVDRAVEVPRPDQVRLLADAARDCAQAGGRLIVVGPPGHGKSWACQQLLDVLHEQGWLVAEHYCYLGDADGERLERVLSEAVLGSLLGRLAAQDPRLVHDQRPRFAADEDALLDALRRSRDLEPGRPVALVVDGIDHVTRVRAPLGSPFDPSKSMSETLAALDLPAGVVLIVLSQPGAHLAALEDAGATSSTLPPLGRDELGSLASRLGLLNTTTGDRPRAPAGVRVGDDDVPAFVDALAERSGGNALYATYLCREASRASNASDDPSAIVLKLPAFDGTLKSYYDHLYISLGASASWVADIIALVDFGVTRSELNEIRPDGAHHVEDALERLAPVLIERATQGGIRIYHESFSRYLRDKVRGNSIALAAILEKIIGWLETKGFLRDGRAFHSLLTLLADAGQDGRVVDLIDPDFVVSSVAAGFAASAINANLSAAVGAASRLGRWPAIVRFVEMSRAADTYQSERVETLVPFADVPAALLGPATLAERLLALDQTVMPARAGLQMCAAVDSLGATPPWRAYMDAYLRESEIDNTVYGEASDQAVALAWLRGRLRLSTGGADSGATYAAPRDGQGDFSSPVDWGGLTEWLDSSRLPAREVVEALLDTRGWSGVTALVETLDAPGETCLAAAEAIETSNDSSGSPRSASDWAAIAVQRGVPAGSSRRLLALGVLPSEIATTDKQSARRVLMQLTSEIQMTPLQPGSVAAWLDACVVASSADPLALTAVEAAIGGDGWFPCWLRFALGLSRAATAPPDERGALALDALHLLTGDLRPFAGDHRACDLYSLHSQIADTIADALRMLDDEQWRSGLGVLRTVSEAISTTLSGEQGGPVPPDLVLRLAVEGANPSRHDIVDGLVRDLLSTGSGGRFYSDIAEYRLFGARLALAAEDEKRARELWHEACVFLAAYGWRKDITVYEVVDPMPALIDADLEASRNRIARLQPLCERVPLHTDGRETRHAPSRWRTLLATADPVAAVDIAAPTLLSECNDPNWRLNKALQDVWSAWQEQVDPLVAGALRLALDMPLDVADPTLLQRISDEIGSEDARRLLVWLLARVDERPVSYSFSNSEELLARDDEKVARINAVAAQRDLPPVLALREGAAAITDPTARRRRTTDHTTEVILSFPPGLAGIARATRTWHRRPHNVALPDWHADRFANVIGYRLMDLLADDRSDDAIAVLDSLGRAPGIDERTTLLRHIAEGLERYDETRLAAYAFALHWTQVRGGGGWLTFGGEDAIESLRRASSLDDTTARGVVAAEIERIIATSSTSTYGITQAIVHAFAAGALRSSDGETVDVAFEAWDEAFQVIDSRVPRVHESDDPEVTYSVPAGELDNRTSSNLDAAFALATVAQLAHPSREKKRRALLATRMLVDCRPSAAGVAVGRALSTLSDPATLAWLLSLLDSADTSPSLLDSCQTALRDLAARDLLTVRSLARRMIKGPAPRLPPSAPREATNGQSGPPVVSDEPPGLDELLESTAGQRIRNGASFMPTLRSTVRSDVETKLSSEATAARLERQLNAFSDRASGRWPDAFLAHREAIEESVQSIASSGRATLMMSGEATNSRTEWENDFAAVLLDSPQLSLTLEALRRPRPALPPPPAGGDAIWMGGFGGEDGKPLVKRGKVLSGTLTVAPSSSLDEVQGGPYTGWYWLATTEERRLKHPEWNVKRELIARRYRAVEIRNVNDDQALDVPPVGPGGLGFWRLRAEPIRSESLFASSQPLIGTDRELEEVGDSRQTLGAPPEALGPLPILLAALSVQPGEAFTRVDAAGTGLALLYWRAEYDVSDYYLARPRATGVGVVIRPDLLAKLAEVVGETRLVLRDYVVGSAELATAG
jgi:hypothetical protein